MFYIGLYWEKHEKIFFSETTRPRALIFGMKHHLVNFYQFVWAKNGPPAGHMYYIGLYREKHEKIFLSETIRPRVLIFGMYHPLVDLYQTCSNYAPRVKNGPAPGVTRDIVSFQQITVKPNSGHLALLLLRKLRPVRYCRSKLTHSYSWNCFLSEGVALKTSKIL